MSTLRQGFVYFFEHERHTLHKLDRLQQRLDEDLLKANQKNVKVHRPAVIFHPAFQNLIPAAFPRRSSVGRGVGETSAGWESKMKEIKNVLLGRRRRLQVKVATHPDVQHNISSLSCEHLLLKRSRNRKQRAAQTRPQERLKSLRTQPLSLLRHADLIVSRRCASAFPAPLAHAVCVLGGRGRSTGTEE